MRINTLLIANRGEIACRIARTARAKGITPVAVHSEADSNALHVREIGHSFLIGGGPASESYLRIDAVVEAAVKAGADAIHPGYGFLAENSGFARAVEAAGLTFVGPTPETLECFGDKASAKATAIAAGVPVISGVEGTRSDPEAVASAVLDMGFPVLLKAVGGGGGRGQRLIESKESLVTNIEAALREARSSFGSEGLLLERYVPNARHVEVQIAGDGDGHVIHLFERDCTLQRRHQKVIEEAPAWGLPRALLDCIAADAVRLAQSVRYRGLGTVEFLVAGEGYFFLEVNPRIQVEHPVTEAITGLDLVALHLRIAQGLGLGLAQDEIRIDGHAVEARLYAEDPTLEFAPSTGRIAALSFPQDLRVDSGVAEGDLVTPFYDPMIAKLVAHGPNRATALARLARALDRVAVAGVKTNRDFIAKLVRDADFGRMAVHTRWIEERLDSLAAPLRQSDDKLWKSVAAILFVTRDRDTGAETWFNREVFTGWRLTVGGGPMELGQRITLADESGRSELLRVGPVRSGSVYSVMNEDAHTISVDCREISPGRWRVAVGATVHVVTARMQANLIEIDTSFERFVFRPSSQLAAAGISSLTDGNIASPLTGLIVDVKVADGDPVTVGMVVAVLESMKLEISIKAPVSGVATKISVSKGTMVDRGQTIVKIVPSREEQT